MDKWKIFYLAWLTNNRSSDILKIDSTNGLYNAYNKERFINMNIVLFEDDREFARKLETIIKRHSRYIRLFSTNCKIELINRAVSINKPALYFIDIMHAEKPEGLSLAVQIMDLSPKSLIVFQTAYPQRILHNPVYKTKAFSFIYKTNCNLENEVKQTIDLAKEALEGKCLAVSLDSSENCYIPYDNICYIEGSEGINKLSIHTLDGNKIVVNNNINAVFANLADHGFARVKKRLIINKLNSDSFYKSFMTQSLENGSVSDLLKGIARERGLSLRRLASMLGISHAYVGKLISGINPRNNKPVNPTINVLIKISAALNISLIDLLHKCGYTDDDK